MIFFLKKDFFAELKIQPGQVKMILSAYCCVGDYKTHLLT